MDDRAFDRLTLALANGLSRRGLGRIGIAALAALGLQIDAPLADVIAAPSKRRKRRKQDRRDAAKEGGRLSGARKKKGKKGKKGSKGKKPKCGAPKKICSRKCVDTGRDRLHCGGCGRKCGNGENCIGGACQPATEPPAIVCGACGDCQRCDIDGETEIGECGKSCAGNCPAQKLCQRAQAHEEALFLAHYLLAQGFAPEGAPGASVLEEDGTFVGSAVSMPYPHSSHAGELAELVLRVDAHDAARALAVITQDGVLQQVLTVGDGGEAREFRSTRQSRGRGSQQSAFTGDESQVSEATCGVCSKLCEWSVATAEFAGALATITTAMTAWPKVAGWARGGPLGTQLEFELTMGDTVVSIHEILKALIERPDDAPRCGGCAADGFCCQPGRRVCASRNAISFSGCVDEGDCCENDSEGTCPPGVGTICSDFRSDRVNCGGCTGTGRPGTDCTNAAADADYAKCKKGVCEFEGCRQRGGAVDPSDGARPGCCRRGDVEQECPGMGRVCAGNHANGACCLDDVCPSDCRPGQQCGSGRCMNGGCRDGEGEACAGWHRECGSSEGFIACCPGLVKQFWSCGTFCQDCFCRWPDEPYP